MGNKKSTAIIIPVYNESKVICSVVSKVLKDFDKVICVNDGSSDSTSQEILKTQAVLVEHSINLGQGAALQTGIEFALQDKSNMYFVTYDADGQHNVKDVKRMLNEIETGDFDIILGSRFLGKAENIKPFKKFFLKAAVRFTNASSGVKLTDTHNGLRVFNRRFAEKLEIKMPDMAHASEIIDIIGRGSWKYKEVPITITYTEYSMKKGQSLLNSINIVFDLFFTKAGHK